MVRARIACAAALAVALLGSPSSALAQSAGDNQYVDPLAGQNSQPTHHATQNRGSSAPSQAAAPSSASPSASAPATSSGAQSSTQASSAAGPSASVPLARTGFDAWIPGLAGIVLIAAAVALRRSARHRRA